MSYLFEVYFFGLLPTGCPFYRVPEDGNSPVKSRRIQVLYAIKLPYLGGHNKRDTASNTSQRKVKHLVCILYFLFHVTSLWHFNKHNQYSFHRRRPFDQRDVSSPSITGVCASDFVLSSSSIVCSSSRVFTQPANQIGIHINNPDLTWMCRSRRCASSALHCLYLTVKGKVKFTLEQTAKAQRGSRGIALLFI